MEESVIGLKLLLEYDVETESLQDYYRFVMGRYIPSMQAMGLQMSEAWHTAYGDAPSRLIGFVCEDQDTMTGLLQSEKWLNLNDQLEKYVSGFSYKVVPYRGGFQI
jgi:hypothetical protein